MSGCVDTNPATDALATILYELIELNEGGNDLQEAAKEVELFFRRADMDFGKWTLEKLEVLRIHADSSTAKDLYRALQKITKLKNMKKWDAPECFTAFNSAIAIAEDAMRKARGESEVNHE